MPQDLAAWLNYIENLHPKSIAMGLARTEQVLAELAFKPPFKIITVGGTNGKGSTCAMLEQMYVQAGFRVGCYTSPHLIRYNERVRVNLVEVSDDVLCAAFAAIESARVKANVALTYFEVGTLAAVWHFMHANIDVAILEVGLGGRLDTVNAFDADCAIVTSIDLDHQEFLGDTREKIGFEKAAIYRPNTPAICGDANPPASLVNYAQSIGAQWLSIHDAFDFSQPDASLKDNSWVFHTHTALESVMRERLQNIQPMQTAVANKVESNVAHNTATFNKNIELPLPMLAGQYQLNNASCAIAAVQALQDDLPVTTAHIAKAMQQVALTGRFQTVLSHPQVILDVAHNPHAARALNANLQTLIAQTNCKVIAVFAMLADKDIQGVVNAIAPLIDVWFVAPIDHIRGAQLSDMQSILLHVAAEKNINTFNSVNAAYNAAIANAETRIKQGENVKIIVFGSFFTVAAVMQAIAPENAVLH